MSRKYEPELKKKIVRLRMEEGRTYKSLCAEYGVSKVTISKWCTEFSEECQSLSQADPSSGNEANSMKEILKLRQELEEVKKENLFLKKAAAFFAKEIYHEQKGVVGYRMMRVYLERKGIVLSARLLICMTEVLSQASRTSRSMQIWR